MERVHVTPASRDLKVPQPERGGVFLPPEGAEVPPSSYWRRRIAEGSVRTRAVRADEETPRARTRALPQERPETPREV